ncbi:MAG: hypothetical protein ACRDE5_15010, partial [Ginsengibacter sp.]
MKKISLLAIATIVASALFSQPPTTNSSKNDNANVTVNKSLFIDVHDLQPGKVSFADVMAAHQKDLATESKYDVNFIKFW